MLKEATGEDISIRAMMEYFKPLMSWLEEQNKGRKSTGSSTGILPVGPAGVSPAEDVIISCSDNPLNQ